MLAIPEATRDTRLTLLYNEEKLKEGKAIFLGAFNYWQDDEQLTFDDKLQRFRDLSVLNERSLAQTIHISLNFHPGDELQLTDKNMKKIAAEFMNAISFEDQPWVLYRHIDAGHPHCHIVTINIRPDGSRIENDLRSPHNLMKICAALEDRHHLTHAVPDDFTLHFDPASRQDLSVLAAIHPQQSQSSDSSHPTLLEYGKSPTKTGISKVLDHVLDRYYYTSLDELNAVLRLYNVRADRGSETGVMYRNRGLYYRMIDDNGNKIGAPIKASSFHQRPTLDYLEKKYEAHQAIKQQHIQRVCTWVDWSLRGAHTPSLKDWQQQLSQDRIQVVTPRVPVRRNQGLPSPDMGPADTRTPHSYDGHGFFYIDFSNYTVYRDTDLGPNYTAAAIFQRTGLEETLQTLAMEKKLTLDKRQQFLLSQANPDPAQKIQLLLGLSKQHDRLLVMQQTETQELRPTQRHRMSL
jgi:Relaxase/Mobilisation nuclease domain